MVSLIRVEDELEKHLPEGTLCCVVEIPDALRGAKIVAAITKPIDERSVLKKMSEKLPNICLPKQFVVIDELHSFLSNVRGVHLQSLLSRLRAAASGTSPSLSRPGIHPSAWPRTTRCVSLRRRTRL